MKALTVSSRACACARASVRVCDLRPLTCTRTLRNPKPRGFACADVALATSEAPENRPAASHCFTSGTSLAAVRMCARAQAHTPARSQAHSKSPYTSIHTGDISTFPRKCLPQQCAIVFAARPCCDLLFQFSKT